jgi:membrane protein DedA with SNARE-associated domain
MPEEVVFYVTKYGYTAVFILVFLQEIGMPNPLPNELLLMFSGYLSFKGILYLPGVLLTVISADFIGTNILYFLFYSTGILILQKRPKWFPLSQKTLDKLTNKIKTGGYTSIYLFRLTPFTRGYTSVICGLLQIKPKVFLPIALFSAITWATVYIVAGRLIGPSWNLFIKNGGHFKYIMLGALIVILGLVIFNHYHQKNKKSGNETDSDDY